MSDLNPKDTPRYIKIAIDIAQRIYKGEFPEGYKLKGRSTLASEYNVSPETIRRSVALLEDMNVVKVHEKSGIYVISSLNAKQFIDKFAITNNLNDLLNYIKNLMAEKNKLEHVINKSIEVLIENTIHFRDMDVLDHHKEIIHPGSHLIGKSIHQIKFWQNTKATIVAIIRDEKTILSPGPDFIFKKGDVVCFVSEKDNVYNVKNYINKKS